MLCTKNQAFTCAFVKKQINIIMNLRISARTNLHGIQFTIASISCNLQDYK